MKKLIRFALNDKVIETEINPGIVLIDFIRKREGVTGTKVGCREGDCGVCTLLMGEFHDDSFTYRAIPGCLTPIGDAHGKHIVTIEGLNIDDDLTPIQAEFVKEGASQCGFCTPGFILSLTNFFINSSTLSYEEAIEYMDGNICRCTGYESIKRAARNLSEKYSALIDSGQNRIMQLIEWSILPDYFMKTEDKLRTIPHFYPHHEKGHTIVAGGTDLLVQRADGILNDDIDFFENDSTLSFVREKDGKIVIGAATTITDLRDSPLMKKVPGFIEATSLMASTIVRDRATISGNIVNASPIGDLSIIMLALNSELTIRSEKGVTRVLPLKDFYRSYKKFDLEGNEFISKIAFESPGKNFKFNFEKVSKRRYLDIASVNSAMVIKTEGDSIERCAVSSGGVWEYPLYLAKTSEFLNGKELKAVVIREAAQILDSEIKPISDIRGSSEYKRLLVRQLFFVHFIKLYPDIFTMEDIL